MSFDDYIYVVAEAEIGNLEDSIFFVATVVELNSYFAWANVHPSKEVYSEYV